MNTSEFRFWHKSMNLTVCKGAELLRVSKSTYADWHRGISRTSKKPIELPPLLGLACAAAAAGLEPWDGKAARREGK